uniref:Alpha 1,4-glycosyltransferase domain-containing protein n=2 Tax=Latimeria chalumnae TaxID=7897 RepID=H3B0R8_LATCH
MAKPQRFLPVLLLIIFVLFWTYNKQLWRPRHIVNVTFCPLSNVEKKTPKAGIVFIETTEELEPPPLVVCAVESAARIYPERPVLLFMKGLPAPNRTAHSQAIDLLSKIRNVFVLPLNFKVIFNCTPLQSWYDKVIPENEMYWTHVSSDASRLALIWKYGGIYLDSDVISMRPIPEENFLAAQSSRYSSNGVLGFREHHPFVWDSMKDFVENYDGNSWGHQGPELMTRMLNKLCTLPTFEGPQEDAACQNISFLQPNRFYPIPYSEWEKFFMVLDPFPDFNQSYALHLWNFMNNKGLKVEPGSNHLIEKLFIKYCPTTYRVLVQKRDEGTVE